MNVLVLKEAMRRDGAFSPTKATLFTILLCSMLMLMGGAAVAPALPLIEQVFPDQGTLVSMIITVPSLAVGLMGFAIGHLADRFGKVRVLCLSLAVFTVAGASGFLIDNIYVMLAVRFVVGIGIAGISSAVTALIAEYYTGMSRVKVLSYQSAAMGVGVLILEYTGGMLAELSWREPFLVYLIGVPILLMVILTMREPMRDAPGDEGARDEPVRSIDRRLVTVCYITIFIAMTMAFLLPTKMPTYLQTSLGVSTSVTGLFLGVHGVANACTSLMYRRLVGTIRPFAIMGIGFVLLFLALFVLEASETVGASVFMMVVAGVGLGMISPAVSKRIIAMVTTEAALQRRSIPSSTKDTANVGATHSATVSTTAQPRRIRRPLRFFLFLLLFLF